MVAHPASTRLAAGTDRPGPTITGQVTLKIEDEPAAFEITIPAGNLAPDDLLPVFQGITDVMVARAEARVRSGGKSISCRAGCGACCRQLVPVSEAEARALARLVEALPEPRRATVRAKFQDALIALDAAGVLPRLDRVCGEGEGDDDLVDLGLDYFRLGIACPFLEAESCSIHSDRPLSCREFLVTSPRENCTAPSAETVATVKMARLSPALRAVCRASTHGGWTPLVTALRFAAATPPPTRDRAGVEILGQVINRDASEPKP